MRVPAAPLLDPEIEDVVQKDVGQERTDARALRRSPVRLTPLTAFQDTGLEPHPDEPEDAPIGDPMREHPHQPLMVNRVEKAADVGIKHPVHTLAHERRVKRVERHMRFRLGRKP